MRLPLAGGAYKGRSSNASSEQCVNLFVEKSANSKVEPSLVNIHGATLFATAGNGPINGMHKVDDYVYVVSDKELYKINESGTVTKIAEFNRSYRTSRGNEYTQASMHNNGTQLVIADGNSLKVFDIDSGTFTTTSSPGTSVADFIDGYSVFVDDGTGRFSYTSLYDATTISALDFETAEGSPDKLVSIITDRREVWLLGEDTFEIWYNTARETDHPFSRPQGGFGHIGCAAKHSVARFDNAICWLSKNELGGYAPVISRLNVPENLTANHPQVAYQMGQYSRKDDAFAYVYMHEGHEFYVLTFPTDNATWAYDALEKEWYQWGHIIDDQFPTDNPPRQRYNCHVFAFDKHLFGDFENGKIYELDSSTYTLESTIIPNIRTTLVNKDNDQDRVSVRRLELLGEKGLGGDVALTYSKDGGHTFSTERKKSFGDSGNYKTRCLWHKLGSAKESWVFRFDRREDAATRYTGMSIKANGE